MQLYYYSGMFYLQPTGMDSRMLSLVSMPIPGVLEPVLDLVTF